MGKMLDALHKTKTEKEVYEKENLSTGDCVCDDGHIAESLCRRLNKGIG
ncbi:hypothetical protein THF1C08_190067 [Vibrio jasicida]|uniref:Uncharacterized protein n=1 Tax=Vibrio jasicida TaxID=766224 RepID=A0AAU9QLZ0_9VIBR|nr:hypothetical protein THF1C08_190067 [Vibrio jasicida]CAH1588517.1 hypothetical protein THF1A12_200068 [Vibrio jasicida]